MAMRHASDTKTPYNTTSGHTMTRLLIASSTANNPFLQSRVDINSTTLTHYTMAHLNVQHGAFHPRLPITTHRAHCGRKKATYPSRPVPYKKKKKKRCITRPATKHGHIAPKNTKTSPTRKSTKTAPNQPAPVFRW